MNTNQTVSAGQFQRASNFSSTVSIMGTAMMEIPQAPYENIGDFYIKNDSIVHIKTHSSGTTVEKKICQGKFWVSYVVKCPETGERSYIVTLVPAAGEPTQFRLTAHMLSNSKEWNSQFFKHGILILKKSDAEAYMLASVASCQLSSKTPRKLILRPGWFPDMKGFHFGNSAIFAAECNPEEYWLEPVEGAPFACRGKNKGWYKNIGRYVEANWIPLSMSCLAVHSLILGIMGHSTKLLNFHGPHGCAKTLSSQMAASIFGNGIDPAQGSDSYPLPYVTKFDTTLNAIEPLLSMHGQAPVFLDEQTEQGGIFNFFYKIGSGAGKNRADSKMNQAKRYRWNVNVITTGETSFQDAALAAGYSLKGGQMDRAIDIPIHDRALEEFLDKEDFQGVTRHLKAACANYYGNPGIAIIQYILDNQDTVKAFIEHIDNIENELAPADCDDGARRVVKHMAGGIVAGYIAIAAGVFKCPPETIESAFKTLVDVWWKSRNSAAGQIAALLNDPATNINATIPKPHLTNQVILHKGVVFIPQLLFDNTFGTYAEALAKELSALGMLKREQSNRLVYRFADGKLRGYAILPDKLKSLVTRKEFQNWLLSPGT